MRWLKHLLGQTDAIQLPSPTPLQFLGEQDGDPERLAKAEWVSVLATYPAVLRAYLVRATVDGGQTVSVVLGIRQSSGNANAKLVDALGDRFRSIFNARAFVDIMFLDEQREAAVQAVCRPFYATD